MGGGAFADKGGRGQNARRQAAAASSGAEESNLSRRVLLWFAVVTVGLAMLAMVMLSGRRLRNMVRRRPPAPTVPDPFWYLRKTPTNVTHGSPNERMKGDGPGAQPDGRSAS